MPASPKKAAKAPAKKAEHPTYHVMVAAAIVALKERSGSSRQAIEKYILANYNGVEKGSHHLKKALKSGVEKGNLVQTKGTGASGSFKIKKAEKPAPKPKAKAAKPAAKKTATKKVAAKKPAAKKVVKKTATKKAASPKKVVKKVAAKKPAAKKTAKKTGKK